MRKITRQYSLKPEDHELLVAWAKAEQRSVMAQASYIVWSAIRDHVAEGKNKKKEK